MEKYTTESFESRVNKMIIDNPKAKKDSIIKLLKHRDHSVNCKYCQGGNHRHGFSLKQMDDIINGND